MGALVATVLITGLLAATVCGQLYSQATSGETVGCHKTVREPATIDTTTLYREALPGEDFTLSCSVCKYHHHAVQVAWALEGTRLQPSSRVHTYQKHPDIYLLVVKQAMHRDMGNYSCMVENMDGKVMDQKIIRVDQTPPPPEFLAQRDRVSSSSQNLTWTGASGLPIIQYLLEFRLSPVSGVGEDWVNLVIPFQASPQSYLLRGLSEGTSYQARVRTKTRHGLSYYSNILEFTTYSAWTTRPTTSRPNTMFSLPQTRQEKQREVVGTSRAKELSAFSSAGHQVNTLFTVLAFAVISSLCFV
jgi:hypothetical protein